LVKIGETLPIKNEARWSGDNASHRSVTLLKSDRKSHTIYKTAKMKQSLDVIRRPMPAKQLKICERGHKFYKSSDCPSCPICVAEDKPETGFLSLLSAPARSALEQEGITTLTALSQHSEREILKFHGMGPKSLPILRKALSDAGLAFAEPVTKR
jgi:hypothetical protein